MTSSQMMLFGGGPPPVTFVGRAISQYTSGQSIFGMSIGGDTAGNIYTAGYNQGSSTALIASFSSTGGYVFQRQLSIAGSTAIGMNENRAIAVDSSGNSYIIFWLRNAAGTVDTSYLVKYNSAGTIQWQRQLTITSGTCQLVSVYLDSTGANVHVGGSVYISGNQAFAIAKYTSAGVLSWQRQLTGGSTNGATDLHVDSSGNVYISGQTNRGTASFDGFIAKYNSAGTIQWQRQFVYGASQGNITSITTDSSSNVYGVTGNPSLTMWKLTSAGATTFQISSTSYLPYRGIICDSTNVYGTVYSGTTTNYISAVTTSGNMAWVNGLTQSGTQIMGGAGFGATGYMLATLRGVTGSDIYAGHFRVPTNGANVSASTISAFPISQVYNTATTGSTSSTSFTNNAGAHTDAAGTMTSATSTLTDAASSNGNNTATF